MVKTDGFFVYHGNGWRRMKIHSDKLTYLAGKWTRIEDVYSLENRDIPASYVSLPEGFFRSFPRIAGVCLASYPKLSNKRQMFSLSINNIRSRWWQLKDFFVSPRALGK